MWFCVNNHMLRYSIVEFQRITGLNCAKIVEQEDDGVNMVEVVGRQKYTLQELEDLYMDEPKSFKYKFKMALLLILEGILLARDRTNTVRQTSINLLHNLEKFNTHLWGRVVYLETLDGLRRGVTKGKKKKVIICMDFHWPSKYDTYVK